MIVRLKGIYSGSKIYLCDAMFQFYDSPIKSKIFYYSYCFIIVFQFYDSPIKRKVLNRAGYGRTGVSIL